MKYRGRARRAAIAAASAALVAAGLGLTAAQALAPEWTLTKNFGSRNASDPSVEYCHIGGKLYMCLYTSQDLNEGDSNVYPMDKTWLYTLDVEAGLDPGNPSNWVDRGVVLPESEYSDWTTTPKDTKHLWAPSMAYGLGEETEAFLYVPDTGKTVYTTLTVGGQTLTLYYSHIGVSSASSALGPFTYKQQITYQGKAISDLYMSDPKVVTTAFSHPGDVTPDNPDDDVALEERRGGPATWLLWANGVWHNTQRCGGISIGLLNDVTMTELITNPALSESQIQINGLREALGDCHSGSPGPYIEGPELYDLAQVGLPLPGGDGRFMLVFSAKPGDSRHQVIAYATAPDPRGPYTYRGIIMNASGESWTNQGSIWADTKAPVTTTNPYGIRFIYFYHDDADNTGSHNRKVYATCLTYDLSEARFLTATRPTSQPNLNNCAGVQP